MVRAPGFAEFYEETASEIYTFGRLLAGMEGEDLAAEAYARALARWNEVSGYDRPDAWIRRVMVNLLITRRRKERIHNLFLQRARSEIAPPSDEDQSETKLLIRTALDKLSPRQRAVIILRYFDDLSLEDTARALRCSVSTASTHLSRARSALRSLLGDDYLEIYSSRPAFDGQQKT